MALLSATHHDDDVKYSNDDCSTDSFLDYCQQEEDAPKCVDSYDFVHDTNTFTPTDIPNKIDCKYFSYIDKNYSKFGNGTLIHNLIDKYIANHSKEIANDVTCVSFYKI